MLDHILPHFDIKDKQKICILQTTNKEEIFNAINNSGLEAICHVDNNGKLIGISCDSDLRKDPKSLINKNPQTIYEGSSQVALNREYIPVINEENILKSVLYRPKEQVLRLAQVPKKITIVGIGYVGLTLAIAFAKNGIEVNCFDKNVDLIEKLKNKVLPFFESGLQEAFEVSFHNLNFHSSIEFFDTENIIVTVGTPLKNNKEVDLNYLYDAINQIFQSKNCKHLENIILRSTVPVGTCCELEKYTKNKFAKNVNFVMCPERTIEGKAIEELSTNPQIIGTSSIKAASVCFKLFNVLTDKIYISNNPAFAELAKLGDNTFRDMTFAYSNFIAFTAQELNIVGSDLIEVMNNNYIRNNLAKPSPGVGGPCLSKDAFIFKKGLDNCQISVNNGFILNGRIQDDYVIKALSQKISDHCSSLGKNKISIAGLAFKGFPETSDIRDSSTLKLIENLSKSLKFSIFDPLIKDPSIINKYNLISFDEFCQSSAVLIIMTNNSIIKSQDWNLALKKLSPRALIIDGWGVLERLNVAVEYDLIYKKL